MKVCKSVNQIFIVSFFMAFLMAAGSGNAVSAPVAFKRRHIKPGGEFRCQVP